MAAMAAVSAGPKVPAPTSRRARRNGAPTTAAGSSRCRAGSPRRRASTTTATTAPRGSTPRRASTTTTLRASTPRRGPTTTAATTTAAAATTRRASYTAPRAYNNGRSYSSRGYAAPRRDPYYRSGYNGYRGYNSYYRPYTSYSRRYVYGGYRGVYGYGGGYRHTRIVTVVPWRPYHYRPHFSIGVYYGAGGVYDYGYTPSSYYDPLPGQIYGGVRITEAPRDAQVFADGYYVGIVDDFDGAFQHVNLEAGQHRIEVRAGGVEPVSFDVYVQPGRTITLRADDYNDGYAGNADGNGDGY